MLLRPILPRQFALFNRQVIAGEMSGLKYLAASCIHIHLDMPYRMVLAGLSARRRKECLARVSLC